MPLWHAVNATFQAFQSHLLKILWLSWRSGTQGCWSFVVQGAQHEAQRQQATLGTYPASLVDFEAHAKVYARKEKLLLSILAGLNLAWISDLLSA